MLPNPDCPDCHGGGAILLLNKMVACDCVKGDEGLVPTNARLEAARRAMAPENLVQSPPPEPESERPAKAGAGAAAIAEPITVNGFRVEERKPVDFYQTGVMFRAALLETGKLVVNVLWIDC